jgi:hypothetical protein
MVRSLALDVFLTAMAGTAQTTCWLGVQAQFYPSSIGRRLQDAIWRNEKCTSCALHI